MTLGGKVVGGNIPPHDGTSSSVDQLAAFIDTFVSPRWKPRLLGFAASAKRRDDVISELHGSAPLDERWLVPIPGPDQHAGAIHAKLVSLGAPGECWCLSVIDSINEKVLPLPQALEECVGFLCETVLFCSQESLGYYEGGHARDRYILRRSGRR